MIESFIKRGRSKQRVENITGRNVPRFEGLHRAGHLGLKAHRALMAQTFPAPTTSREMRQDRSAVSGPRNNANRGNRKVTYHAYRAFFALFWENALWQRDKQFGLASPCGHT
jgi:hypothetical protein